MQATTQQSDCKVHRTGHTLCTYFDRSYLVRGLSLYESLVRHWPAPFELVILCLDHDVYRVMGALKLPHVRLMTLSELEASDPALLHARHDRSTVGYYLTTGPSLIRHLLPGSDAVVYLDADLFFFSSAEPALREFSAGSIYVHEHRPDHPELDVSAGRFNVGMVGIRNDEQGRVCVDLWRKRCLEWCEHARVDGRFGDQKYLDEWPKRFDRLVVARCRGVGAGPWNLSDLHYSTADDGQVQVDSEPLVFFHFTRLERIAPGIVRTFATSYLPSLPPTVRRHVYRPYLQSLRKQSRRIAAMDHGFAAPFERVMGGGHDVYAGAASMPNAPWRRAISLVRGLSTGELMLSWGNLAF